MKFDSTGFDVSNIMYGIKSKKEEEKRQEEETDLMARNAFTWKEGCPPDALKVAEAFAVIRIQRIAEDGVDIADDVDTMLGWFANAIMGGHDSGSSKYDEHAYNDGYEDGYKEGSSGRDNTPCVSALPGDVWKWDGDIPF